MSRRVRNPLLSRAFKRSLGTFTRMAVRVGTKAIAQALRPAKPVAARKVAVKRVAAKKVALRKAVATARPPAAPKLRTGFAAGISAGVRYRLFVPTGLRRGEQLPLLVMLHGCGQDAEALAASTRMNQIAARERFFVLYPEQDRMANLQGCWNWFQTRTGRAQAEADAILAAVLQICRTQAVDAERIALAGLSAGAGMAALLATRHPQHFQAIAMHSGVAPGLAHSTASALGAMRGLQTASPLAALAAGEHLPALLVIQGKVDGIVASVNGDKAAQLWAQCEGAKPGPSRTVQRGARYASTITDYSNQGRLVSTLCEIAHLGHAWSGGAASQAYSDPKGPDASRMIWAFAAKQFGPSTLLRTGQVAALS